MNSQDILDFWFEELTPQQWYKKDPELDQLIGQRFEATLIAGSAGELSGWRETLTGRLAEIILLDQFQETSTETNPKRLQVIPWL